MMSSHQPSPERIPKEPGEPSIESLQKALREAQETILRLTTENNDLRKDKEKSSDIIRAQEDVIQEQGEKIERLERFATKDSLTGIENRDGLQEKMLYLFPPEEKELGNRNPEKKASVLILDVDKFKSINDENGHAAGDHVLAELTERLKDTIRIKEKGKGDILCRWGGDEIVIVFWGANAQDIINKFYQQDSNHAGFSFDTEFEGKNISVTLSGGVTDLIPGETIEDAVARADNKGLHEAKEQGKNMILKVPAWPEETR